MARCLLKSMGVPGMFWGEAVKTAVYLLNRAPTKSLNDKTPFEAWYGRKPGVKHLRVFGCTTYAKKLGPGISKLTDRTISGVFLGYEPGSKGFRVYDPAKGRLMVSRDVLFDEKKAWNWGEKDDGRQATTAAPSTFLVDYSDADTIPGPTIDQEIGQGDISLSDDGATAPASPNTSSIPSQASETGTPGTPGSTPLHHPVQFATPPTGGAAYHSGTELSLIF
jgi:hypothetical protein